AAASTFRLTGMPSAALPLDLCAPAEALGAVLNYYERGEYQFPQPARPLFASTKYLNHAYFESADFVNKGRIPVICDALRLLKADVGDEVVISGIIPGPYTLLLYLIEPGALFAEMKREPNTVLVALFHLSSFLAQIGNRYKNAGADFITIHDMGGSPGFIGPAKYEQFVFPAEKQLIEKLSKPCVLSMCGNTNKSLHLLAQTGADAISVDQLTGLAAAREALKDTLLFGNLDPVGTLYRGDEADITEAVRAVKGAGVDAVWPGCDIVPQTPIQNIATMLED
ncbi:MAG TPA: uroporphyrinogen decarboxylase family protein, partial [Anaerolineales bacterium]|nr:uroporphyrinogen decarboxylase family protein [Anaerolineales bacterium]